MRCRDKAAVLPDSFRVRKTKGIVSGPSFPEAPGLPDRASGPVREGGFDNQTAPRLECPAAVFLEELQTGAIECHAWDAAGEEFLEYSWEPVGSTTRAYLDNPRLLPEDVPNPSVVAPEAPAYETLESFRSGETTFVYRYRLTATSRATGLSSREEVEVYVSSSRPGVYCPLEVAVEEGATAQLDCEGADPLSSRMDYDEDGASIAWEWEGLWATSTAPLDATDRSSALFTAPPGSAGKTYHYIASMTSSASGVSRTARRRVTVRVTGAEGAQAAGDVSGLAYKGSSPVITCNDAEVYEATADFTLDCSVTDEPAGATYAWAARLSPSDTSLLSSTTILKPTFYVPDDIDQGYTRNKSYLYKVTMTADGIDGVTDGVGVKVLEKPDIWCQLFRPSWWLVNEGSQDFALEHCNSSVGWDLSYLGTNTPFFDPVNPLSYEWTSRGSTSDTNKLSATNIESPTFFVPDDVSGDTTFEYLLTVSAENADPYRRAFEVAVRDTEPPSITCVDTKMYEATADITLDCTVTKEPSDAAYSWAAQGSTSDTNKLSSTTMLAPTFYVPHNITVYSSKHYAYTVTLSASGIADVTEDVKVTVLEKPDIRCSLFKLLNDLQVNEGSGNFMLRYCRHATSWGLSQLIHPGTPFRFEWTPRGSTPDTNLLSAPDIELPTFFVPDDVSGDKTFHYLMTVSAENTDPYHVYANVTVRDTDPPPPSITCVDTEVYEGASDITLDCTVENEPANATYSWTGTDISTRLSGIGSRTPTFAVPDNVNRDTDYDYTVTLSAVGVDDVTEVITVAVLNAGALRVACASPASVYEGSEDFAFDCEASGAPSGSDYTYAWTARGDTQDTSLLSAANIASPVLYVPDEVAATTTYEYLLTVSAENAESGSAAVTVTVLNAGALRVACASPASVYEGSEDFAFDCEASGAPSGSDYTYAWTARGDTQDTSLLSAANIASPVLYVPDEVAATTTYEYLLTVSAANAESGSAAVTVTVLNRGALSVVCVDPPSVYEGSADFALNCSASGAPSGSDYTHAWTARGDAQDTSLLSATDIASPTFYVPDEVAATTTYEYLLTVSAANAESGSAAVTVTVLNRGALSVVCVDPGSVYEGSEDIAFDCTASGASSGSDYAYAWTARGDTPDTALLSVTDIASPTFYVPDEVDAMTTYEYLLTVSAANAESGSAAVTVTVLNLGALSVVCVDPGSIYEGSADFALNCSASGAPSGSDYAYAWTARGDTQDTSLLSATDIASPTFYVPDEMAATTTYEYLLTVSAANAESGSAAVTVTVLSREMLSVTCPAPRSVYEDSEDFELDCSASGGSDYDYVWTARGSTANTDQLSAADISSPTFYVPDELDATTTYEYLLTVSADNTISGTAEVSVTVLNKGALAVVCTDPGTVYEGSADIAFDCSASGASSGSDYAYAWTARGDAQDTSLLSAANIASPTFYVPDEAAATTTYEYLLTVSADNTISGTAEVSVTVLNKGALAVACADPGSVYEGSEDIAFDCTASGAPSGSNYTYVWTARGDTPDTALLSAADMASPMFHVPEEVDEDETYEYLLIVSAENAEDASVEVTVTVLNKGALAVVCTDPGSVYEGSEDIAFDCSASGAPGDNPEYAYAWTARGDTPDTALLSAADMASPMFHVPEEVDENKTYEYVLTISATNAEAATAEVTVTVLDRIQTPPSDPFSRPLASSSAREPSEPSAPGVTASASPLRFGVQSADTQVSLDPMTDGISTHVSGPYHVGRMTLSPGGGEALDENGEMALSIELASPVVLRREGGIGAASLVLSPSWSYAESCEQLSFQAIGGLYTEVTLSEGACRLLRFGGELDLTDAPSGRYAGSMDLILRSGESEETHSVEVDVTVVPAQRVITIGPGGVRFSTSRELPAGLTEEQNLSIYPDIAFLTEEKPHGVFELSNPSLIPLEVSVSARFGYTEATENGREVVVEDPSGSPLGDLSQVVDIHPGMLVLMPGEKGLVRYGMQEGAFAAMAEKGYAAFFDVASSPRQYVDLNRMPEEVTGEKTARVTMRVPGVYGPAEGASQLRAALLSVSYVGSMSATFLLETQDHPFAGEVVAYDGDGRELGRRETLVYTRSRVRIPLNRVPEGGAVFLRFMPRGSGRVPEPASVEWDAPRRDIGAAEDKDRTTTTETLVQRP